MALPAIGLIIGGVMLAKKLFGRTLKSGGIRGEFGGEQGFTGSEYKFYKGGLFRSDATEISALDKATQNSLAKAYLDIRAKTQDYVKTLGLGAQSIAGFTQSIDIITLGQTQEQISKQIDDQLTVAADGLAGLALGTTQFTRDGETASGTLARLATGLETVNGVMETLGHRLLSVSLYGGDAASSLVDLFGGADAFNSATASYFDAFYSQEEKVSVFTKAATRALAEFGRMMPTTRDAYKAMVAGADLTSESGRKLYTTLIGLSGAMNTVLPVANSLTAAMANISGNVTSGINAQVNAISSLVQQSKAASGQSYTVATTLDKLIQSMLSSDIGGTSSAQQLLASRNAYLSAFANAKGGEISAARDIPGLSKAFLKSSLAQAKTAQEYALTAAKVRSDVRLLAGISGLEGANKEVLVTLYERQLDVLGSLKEYIAGGNIDADVIGKFSSQLGSLETAVKQAEVFSYRYLQDRLKVSVDLIADAKIPAHMRRLLDNAATGITSTIDFVVRARDLTPELKWIALQSSSQHIKSLKFLVGKDLPPGIKRIALQDVGALDKTVNLISGSHLGHDMMSIALAGNSELSRKVNVVLGSKVSSKAMKLALGNIGAYTATISGVLADDLLTGKMQALLLEKNTIAYRKIMGKVDLSGLGTRGKALLDMINGSSNGKLTLAGGVVFDPSSSFSNLFENKLVSPMSGLQGSLIDLKSALLKDLTFREKLAQRDARLVKAEARLSTLKGKMAAGEATNKAVLEKLDALKNAAKIIGWTETAGGPGDIAQGEGGGITRTPIYADNSAEIRALEKQLSGGQSLALKLKEKVNKVAERLQAMRQVVPGFASGGFHAGGLRVVGENGPELEFTGPSRIASNPQSRQLLDNSELVAELRALRGETSRMRADLTELSRRNNRNTKQAADTLDRWEAIGQPAVRTA
jgi:hypothetical protein